MKTRRVYFSLLAVGSAGLSWLAVTSLSTLLSGQAIDQIIEQHLRNNSALTLLVPAHFLLLVLLANLDFFRTGSALLFFLSALWFSVFTLFDYWVIGDAFFHFKKTHGLWKGEFSLGWIYGIFWCMTTTVLTALNYAAVRMIRRYTQIPARRPPVDSGNGMT